MDFLSKVTCVSASDCWAVGYYSGGRYTGGVDMKTLTEHWDGTEWTVVDSPNPTDVGHNYLTDVTCVSASACWAVGYYVAGSRRQTLIEHWDGSAWGIVSSPNTTVEADNLLHGVTCTSPSDCWAVGYHSTPIGAQTLIERWDGTSWAIVSSPNGAQISTVTGSPWGASVLNDVTCASASQCWAVGNYFNGLADQTLIQRWDGTLWTVVSSPNAAPAARNFLQGVTCVSASECWAVGSVSDGIIHATLTLHWDGTLWLPAVPPIAAGSTALYGVTCASASDCWAVGASDVAGSVGQLLAGIAAKTVTAHWDGLAWTVVDSPNTSASQPNVLSGVTCVSGSECWSVGWAGGFAFETLTQRWDGSAWAVVDSPNARAAADHLLSDVACTSAAQCWAVGYDLAGNAIQPLIERWDGTAWTIAGAPTRSPDHDHQLTAVTCVSASDCWAVGYELATGIAWQTLIEHWDGNSWAIVSSANTAAAEHNVLSDVTCVSASECWAVGNYSAGLNATGTGYAWHTLIQRWDGTAWTVVSSPDTAADEANVLSAVTCASASDCWAVGNHGTGGGVDQTLIEHWDGTAWSIAASPNRNGTAAESNVLSGVTCVLASDCWAVGSSANGNALQTLIERWDGTSWTIAGSPTTGATQSNVLSAVTCVSASECWAVGSSSDGVEQTLIQRWDGSAWAIFGSPNTTASRDHALSGVTCLSASKCWAVGYYNAGLIAQTLVEEYTR